MIRAAGGVLWREGPSGREVAVVHRPRYDDWSLPKGKLHIDEPHLLAAVREVHEETGFTAMPGSSLGVTSYTVDGVAKTVRWWSLRATEGTFAANAEVDALRWLDPATATAVLGESPPLQRWRAIPPDAGMVLLVRHGSAGDAQTWDGDDDQRPLDHDGRQQALTIARVLSAYRPIRIVSAPPLRCRDTIAPLAALLGLPVDIDVKVGENGAPAAPERHVVSLAAPGETVVVCSQGGVIPRVIEALAPHRAPARAGKGNAWALTLAGDRAVVADDDVLT